MIKSLLLSSVTRSRFFTECRAFDFSYFALSRSRFYFSYLALSRSALLRGRNAPPPPPHLFRSVRGLLSFFVPALPPLLRGGRVLLFLVGAGLLLIALTACAGGEGETAASSPGTDTPPGGGGNPGDGSPGEDDPGVVALRTFGVNLTFAPISGGFRIGNQSDFGDLVSLNITATSGSESVERGISIAEFVGGSYDFTGLDDQSDWIFNITGTLSDGSEQEVRIDFVWQENREDHGSGGIRSGLDTDGDRRADSVDDDIDGDGVDNREDRCRVPGGETGWQSNSSSDKDGDGCRDESEDIDDDGDGLIEIGTAVELDAVRYALNGEGRRSSEMEALDTTGCGGADGVTSCSGYELVSDISLASYANWRPLGNDTDSGTSECQGEPFDGIFEGNGFMISDLSISRSGEDCVGLFGYVKANSEIRNLTLHAERVIAELDSNFKGGDHVGGLVGWGDSARISSVSLVAAKVRGGDDLGGLVGYGDSARITSSSVVVADQVRGDNDLGGLVGDGQRAKIISSSVVVGKLDGANNVGGLVGRGRLANIISSSVVAGVVSGFGSSVNIGGLMGSGGASQVVSSSVVVSQASGGLSVGGLVGDFTNDLTADLSEVAYSYVVSGNTMASMLVGRSDANTRVVASYWDSETSDIDTGSHGEAKPSNELRGPIGYTGIYGTWDDGLSIEGDSEVEDITIYCDEDNSGSIEEGERIPDNLIWDFGTSSQYPAIRCTPMDPDEWRSWWFLNGTGEPQLNQTRLDSLVPSLK